jgi:hypothetical protein
MPDRLDFDSARRVLHEIAPTDTWEEATLRAATGSLVQLDAEDATASTLRRRPRRQRPPIINLLAIAACTLAVVGLAAIVMNERQAVQTTDPSNSPRQTTDCPDPTQPRAITQGAQMNKRFAAPVASAATAIMLLGACSDDGPTTLAKGEDVELVGDTNLAGQTLNISAEEEDGEVTGELRFTDPGGEVVVAVECADTDTDGVVVLGGTVTESTDDQVSGLVALFVREGAPDSVTVWFDEGENASCGDLLKNRHDVLDDESGFVAVEAGSDIETG